MTEAHEIRNTSTNTFKAVEELEAERRWCLTGTPVHNRIGDLFALVKFLRFYPFAKPSVARDHIILPIRNREKRGLDNLQSMMRLFSLRRVKDLSSIPRRHNCEVIVNLSEAERHQYNLVKRETLSTLSKMANNHVVKTSHVVLQAITRWRQICCHGLLEPMEGQREHYHFSSKLLSVLSSLEELHKVAQSDPSAGEKR